jgi:archaellum component FlaG (FlaF/FlaG flagellin family)
VPYGFNINSPLSYTWNINGTDHDELSQNRSITLKVNSGDKGKSDISLDIKNVGDDILESAKAEFSAVFNGTQQKNTTIKF